MLFELPEQIESASDCPQSWIKNIQIINLWAEQQKYNTHDVNWFMKPDGAFVCNLPNKKKLRIEAPDELGETIFNGQRLDMQSAFDEAYEMLCRDYTDSRYIWDLKSAKRWGKAPASEKQLQLIRRKGRRIIEQSNFDMESLTKLQASQILNRLIG